MPLWRSTASLIRGWKRQLENTGDDNFPWALLLRHHAQCRRHHGRIPPTVIFQQLHQSQLCGAPGANGLFQTGLTARDDDRPLIQRQDFAECIVSAHRNDAGGLRLLRQPQQQFARVHAAIAVIDDAAAIGGTADFAVLLCLGDHLAGQAEMPREPVAFAPRCLVIGAGAGAGW